MSLRVYRDAPFNTGTEVDPPDLYTGDGVTTTFTLAEKTVDQLGPTIVFGNVAYPQYTGGYVKTSSGFTLDEAPFGGVQGVAPGLNSLLFDNLFDADVVGGVPNPRTQDIPLYLIDIDSIPFFTYLGLPSLSGIELSVVDNISSYGAQISWTQLACATPDGAGSAMTFQATGTALYTGPISAFGSLLASSTSSASSIMVSSASSFIIGDFILINTGSVTQEVQKVIGFTAPNILRLSSGLNFGHAAGETVFTCGRKFWMRCTVPSGATGGQPASLYDLALQNRYVTQSRL